MHTCHKLCVFSIKSAYIGTGSIISQQFVFNLMILDHGPILFIHVDVCSVEIFTPLYTSRVIQGIAIDKSEATFVNAIIWMSILSAARYDRLIFLYCNEPFDVTARRRPTYSV